MLQTTAFSKRDKLCSQILIKTSAIQQEFHLDLYWQADLFLVLLLWNYIFSVRLSHRQLLYCCVTWKAQLDDTAGRVNEWLLHVMQFSNSCFSNIDWLDVVAFLIYPYGRKDVISLSSICIFMAILFQRLPYCPALKFPPFLDIGWVDRMTHIPSPFRQPHRQRFWPGKSVCKFS